MTRRRRAAPAARPVHGGRDPEPRRVRGHLPAARGAARPLPAQADHAAAAARGRDRRAAPARPGFDPRDLHAAGSGRSRRRPTSPPAREAVARVQIRRRGRGYIVDIARATRSSPSSRSGVLPRGATALLATARAWAWLSGRDYVTPDDVKALARADAARTGVALRPEAELEGVSVDARPRRRRSARCRSPASRWRSPGAPSLLALLGWCRSRCGRRAATVLLVAARARSLLVGRRPARWPAPPRALPLTRERARPGAPRRAATVDAAGHNTAAAPRARVPSATPGRPRPAPRRRAHTARRPAGERAG